MVTHAGGKTIVITTNAVARPYDNRWMSRAPPACTTRQGGGHIVGRSPKDYEWEPFAPFQADVAHLVER